MQSPFKLVQITDCHLFADPTKSGYADINPYQSLQQVLSEVSKHNPDIVLVTGDVSGDYSEQSYSHFTQLWQDSGITANLLSVAGNHDNIDAWQRCFSCAHDYQVKVLQFGNWHLHLLPSEFNGAKGLLNPHVTQSMFDSITTNTAAHHIVALHHPLTCSTVWMDKHRLVNSEIFTQHLPITNLRAVLHGHVHTERKVMVHNTPVYACPSTCWQWGNTPEFSVTKQMPGFRIVELQNDGQLETATRYLSK